MNFVTGNSKSTTRERILNAIKQANHVTVDELADVAKISSVTVRHHLNTLQADGLLEIETMRQKVGRPFYIYRLSPKGHEMFPQKYVRLSRRLFEQLKAKFPQDVVNELLKGVVEQIVAEHQDELTGRSFEERLAFLMTLLAEEGFMAEWKAEDDAYTLIEHSCPYQSVGESHHEICTFDKELIKAVLQVSEDEVEQHSCVLDGDSCCQFTISPDNIAVRS